MSVAYYVLGVFIALLLFSAYMGVFNNLKI